MYEIRTLLTAGVAVSALVGALGEARAQGAGSRPAPQAASMTVVLAPLSTLGAETSATAPIRRQIEAQLQAVPGVTLISEDAMLAAIRQARRPELRTCDGDAACLAQLGTLLSASHVVFGEVGGLGSAQVVYMKVIEAKSGKELESTTLEEMAPQAAKAAAYRLLAPARYVGRLALEVDVTGAAIYLDGQRRADSPTAPLTMSVGTHALRVTHPEFRDFVRFVDIRFDDDEKVVVDLQQFPVISSGILADPSKGPGPADNVIYRGQEPTPWYRRWYAVAGVTTVVLVGSAVLVGVLVNGIDADRERVVGGEMNESLSGASLRF